MMVVHPEAHILVVDDDPACVAVLARMLNRAGYQRVTTVTDPRQVLEVCQATPPDLVLLDLRMPHIDGFELLSHLAGLTPAGLPVPVLVLTGLLTEEARHRALAGGARDFLTKPFDPLEALQRIDIHLESRFRGLALQDHSQRLEELVAERTGELTLFKQVLEAIADPVAIADPDALAIRYANQALWTVLDRTPAPLPATPWQLVPSWDEATVRRRVHPVVAGHRETLTLTTQMPGPHGGGLWLEVLLQRVPTRDGAVLLAVARDVTDRERAAASLRRTVDRERQAAAGLQALDRLRDQLLTAVSHEVRTPLTILLGAAKTLHGRWEGLDFRTVNLLTRRLVAEGERLERLLDGLLDLNSYEQGLLTHAQQPVDLAEVVSWAMERVELDDRPISLEVAPVTVPASPRALRRLVRALLDNVAVHTPPGTAVRIAVTREPHGVHLVVADTGPGIPPELATEVWEPFRQGPDVPAHSPGTGMGLSLVAAYAAMHGGRAWLAETPGGGTTVHVLLRTGDVEPVDPPGRSRPLAEPVDVPPESMSAPTDPVHPPGEAMSPLEQRPDARASNGHTAKGDRPTWIPLREGPRPGV